MKTLNGMEITSVQPHYEHITITAEGKEYFIDPKQLVIILSEFNFNVEKKRTRSYLSLDIEDYYIENLNESDEDEE